MNKEYLYTRIMNIICLFRLVDNIITGAPTETDMVSKVLDEVEDRFRLPMKGGAIR